MLVLPSLFLLLAPLSSVLAIRYQPFHIASNNIAAGTQVTIGTASSIVLLVAPFDCTLPTTDETYLVYTNINGKLADVTTVQSKSIDPDTVLNNQIVTATGIVITAEGFNSRETQQPYPPKGKVVRTWPNTVVAQKRLQQIIAAEGKDTA